MVTLDRRKLAAPLFAQAAAFVAVLVIGGFTGHASTTTGAGATPSATVRPSPTASVTTSSAASKGAAVKLTVRVVEHGNGGPSVAGSEVNVLQNRTLASVAFGVLSPTLEFAANVPAGQYQVCVNPPLGWASAVRGAHVLGAWICSAADLRTAPQQVTFRLTPQVPQVGQ